MDIRDKYPPEYKCDDGHFVRSKAEMLIDNWLFYNDIKHAYEIRVHLPSAPKTKMFCDFYLPKLNIYIEYWGREDDEKYEKRRNIKQQLYSDDQIEYINIWEDDIKQLNEFMIARLAKAAKLTKTSS